MDPFTIFSMLAGILSTVIGVQAQQEANEQNIALARETREDQQQYASEAADKANATTVNMYNQLYSPEAKVKQIKNAGLSVGLMYGNAQGAGGAAAQAATPAAATPVVNPLLQGTGLLDMFNAAAQAATTRKTEEETKKTTSEIESIQQNIKESQKRIEQMESTIKNTEQSTANAKLEAKLLDYQIKFQEGTINEQIESVKASLELIENQRDEAWERIMSLKVDNKWKEKFKEQEYEYLKEQTNLVIKQQLLTAADTLKAEAQKQLLESQKELTDEQVKEIKIKIKTIEDYGYMVVNGTGWQDRIVTAMFHMMEDLANWTKGKKRKKGETYTNPNVPGAGGKF